MADKFGRWDFKQRWTGNCTTEELPCCKRGVTEVDGTHVDDSNNGTESQSNQKNTRV